MAHTTAPTVTVLRVVRGTSKATASSKSAKLTHLAGMASPTTLCGLQVMCSVASLTVAASCRKCSGQVAHLQDTAQHQPSKGRGKFTRGNNPGTGTCRLCGKRTQAGILQDQCDLCDTCYDAAGMENEHNDGNHDGRPNPDCAACQEVATITQALAEPDIKGLPAALLPLGHAYVVWAAPSMAGRCKLCGRREAKH